MKPYYQTPGASQGNAFTRHFDGEPSIFCKASTDRTPQSISSELAHSNHAQMRQRGPDMIINMRKDPVASPGRKPGEHVFTVKPQTTKQRKNKVRIGIGKAASK